MAKITLRHYNPYSGVMPINPQLGIDIRSIPGLFHPTCTIVKSQISSLFKRLTTIQGIKVKELKLSDLMFPAYSCNGVYLFYDINNILLSHPNLTKVSTNPYKIVYIGKAGGRSFIERIAAHFASRENDYMNNMIKNMAALLYKAKSDIEIDRCFPIAMEFFLKIIYFPACCSNIDVCIEQLEKELINYYGKPLLNKR